ncbi:hypothetical protein Scep_012498 [Stephania cephalantha]|uniref:DYW domain-containing protein n=1 Tax=Stephania cephalantha TaxID=152367 RepID=A0AAP0P9L2_9MAGN
MYLITHSTQPTHLTQIHSLLLKTSLLSNNFILANFLRRIISNTNLLYARSVFDQISNPDAFIWNSMIRAYLAAQIPQQSIALFDQMRREEGVLIDSFNVSLVVQACGRAGDVEYGLRVHTHVFKRGFCSDLFVQTALIEMYAKLGFVGVAERVLGEIEEPDLVMYNVLLGEHVRVGEVALARRLFDEMPERDLVSWNTMVHGFVRCGDVGGAREVFDEMPERDLVGWSSMIAGYAKSARPSEAVKLFYEMQLDHVRPDGVVMVSVLSACGEMGALGMGRMVHEYIARNRIEVDVKLGTSLVDMYAKCGDIENSLTVFENMVVKDVYAWSTMIVGLANHGKGELALDYFAKMISLGVEPDDVAFIGALSACTHVGFVERGRTLFSSMNDVYRIEPKIEHYGCMIDLLGRTGQLEEARELIKNMPFAPDAAVWRALLSACKRYKNAKLAEDATVKLLELDPHSDENYVLLSNMYSQTKKWSEVANIRRLMRARDIQKIPGSSSIEADNVVHEFIAGDKSHPKSNDIYDMLEEMNDRLYAAGYEPVMSSVLQEMDDQTKQNALVTHSEKIAIAFGLLSTPSGSPIRIVKNLRVCEDCHLAIGIISSIYHRKIIVRDRNRFHHFVDGSCSCQETPGLLAKPPIIPIPSKSVAGPLPWSNGLLGVLPRTANSIHHSKQDANSSDSDDEIKSANTKSTSLLLLDHQTSIPTAIVKASNKRNCKVRPLSQEEPFDQEKELCHFNEKQRHIAQRSKNPEA